MAHLIHSLEKLVLPVRTTIAMAAERPNMNFLLKQWECDFEGIAAGGFLWASWTIGASACFAEQGLETWSQQKKAEYGLVYHGDAPSASALILVRTRCCSRFSRAHTPERMHSHVK